MYEKADNGSAVLAIVPGETKFIIIEKGGSFTKIKLLGVKEGYISNEYTKK